MLSDTLKSAREMFPNRYREMLPIIIEEWVTQTGNQEVLRVLRGETTFEELLRPLTEANMRIDPRIGTDGDFNSVAMATERNLHGVMSLAAHASGYGSYVDLTYGVTGRNKQLKSLMWSIPLICISMVIFVSFATLIMSWFMDVTEVNWSGWKGVNIFMCLFGAFIHLSGIPWAGKQARLRKRAVPLVIDKARQLDQLIVAH